MLSCLSASPLSSRKTSLSECRRSWRNLPCRAQGRGELSADHQPILRILWSLSLWRKRYKQNRCCASLLQVCIGQKEAHRQMLIGTFGNAIFLYDDKVPLTFDFKDGTKNITFAEVRESLKKCENGSELDCFGDFGVQLVVFGLASNMKTIPFSAISIPRLAVFCSKYIGNSYPLYSLTNSITSSVLSTLP